MRRLFLPLLLPLLLPLTVRADLTPDMVRRAKVATALVRVVGQTEGTAFHIGDGVFLTNHHVIEDAAGGAKIEIILNSGDTGQKILLARLARADKELDLAMIKVDAKDPKELPPALEIGNTTDLIETMQVGVFGFPFGSDLASKDELPTISVNIGRVTALRKAMGKLDAIQVDTPVSPGNSGGPLVDGKGQVIGVIQAHVPGTALTFAIPADRVRKFIYGTGLVLRVSPIQLAAGAPSLLTVDVVTQKKEGAGELTATIRLSAFPQDQREYRATPTAPGASTYSTQAPLLPAVEADDLNADIEEQGESWSIRVKDMRVQVAGRTTRLSEIKVISQGVGSSIQLTNGQTLAGTVAGLKSVACIRNGKPSTVDLSRAPTIRFSKPSATSSKAINYEVIVRNGSDVVASQKGIITADGVRPEIARTKPEEFPLEIGGESNLPAGVRAIRWPKNGHYYAAVHISEGVSWTAAAAVASRLIHNGKRGHLVTLSSNDEALFLLEQFRPNNERTYWLGGFRDGPVWRWVTREAWVFDHWDEGQPNNGPSEDRVLLYGSGMWHDANDTHPTHNFIVEFE